MITGEARADGLSGQCLQLSQLPLHSLRLAPALCSHTRRQGRRMPPLLGWIGDDVSVGLFIGMCYICSEASVGAEDRSGTA